MTTARSQDPLRAFLSGKRGAPRIEVELRTLLRGANTEVEGRTMDISEGGALVCVQRGALGLDEGDGELGTLRFVDTEWSDGFDIVFVDRDVVVEANVVRLVHSRDNDDLFLGCRFAHPLTSTQELALGLIDEAPGTEEPQVPRPTSVMPWVAGSKPVAVLIYVDPSQGPRYVGSLVAAGGSALAVEVEGTREEVRAALREQISFDVRLGTALLWSSAATLASVRFLDRPGGGAEVVLLANGKVPRRLRRVLVRRPK